MTTKHKPKVIAFYHFSALSQAANKRNGIAAQKAAVARSVIQHDLDVVSEIEMVGVSRSNVMSSPEFSEMLEKVSSHEIDGVVVSSLDRLVPTDTPENISILDRFVAAKASIYTEGEVLDLATNEGYITAHLRLACYVQERRNFAQRLAFMRLINRTLKKARSDDGEDDGE